MEKEQRKGWFCSLSFWVFALVFPWLFLQVLWGNRIHRFPPLVSPETRVSEELTVFSLEVKEKEKHGGVFLGSLLEGDDDRRKMAATGLACNEGVDSKHCVVNTPLQIDTTTMTVTVTSPSPVEETVVKPYARQEDKVLLQRVTPVRILAGNSTPPLCRYTHDAPAVVFSTSGFVGNLFHEVNEIIIPLYITTRRLNSTVVFVVEDYNPSFMKKYAAVMTALTSSEIINTASNKSVHCFPNGVIGLKFHSHLAINPASPPTGLTTAGFRRFLRRTLHLRFSHVSQIRRPRLLLLSRRSTRRILNEDELIAMMEDLGLEVIRIHRSKTVSNLKQFAKIINSCSVFVAAHGAGMTNEVFLPDGAVVVQFDLIGLNWAAAAYYGDPSRGMGLRYLRYEIKPEESSLWKVFGGKNSKVFSDPDEAFSLQVGREVYLNGQNVRVDVKRFRETMVEAMSLVRDSPL